MKKTCCSYTYKDTVELGGYFEVFEDAGEITCERKGNNFAFTIQIRLDHTQ
jgi:hypothetical protein